MIVNMNLKVICSVILYKNKGINSEQQMQPSELKNAILKLVKHSSSNND